MPCVFESYTWGWRWSPGRRHERLSVRRCHTERRPPPLSWAASQAWGHKRKGGHTPLHPPHRAPGDCDLVRRVWILETQHILACTDNYSQPLLNYSCLTSGVSCCVSIYTHLTIKCQCADLYSVGAVFFFPIYLGSGCSLSGTWQMRSATCFLPSSRHEIPCGFCPQETPVQRSHTQLQFRF